MPVIISRNYMVNEYETAQRLKKADDICMTWIQHSKKIGVMNMLEMVEQINEWKTMGLDMRINDANTKSFEFQGKTWFVVIVQEYKHGELYQANQWCCMSLMLFGVMVSGYTYAFETAEERDTIIPFIRQGDLIKVETVEMDTNGPIEVFKPFELIGKFNKIDTEFLCELRTLLERGFRNAHTEFGKEYAGEIKFLEINKSMVQENPTLRGLALQYDNTNYAFNETIKELLTVCLTYAQEDLLKNIEKNEIKNSLVERMRTLIRVKLGPYITARIDIMKKIRIEHKAIQEKLEAELAATPLVEERVEVNTKEELKKETTRKANKAKNQKEKERLEYEARVAEANRILAEQEKKKKLLKAKKQQVAKK